MRDSDRIAAMEIGGNARGFCRRAIIDDSAPHCARALDSRFPWCRMYRNANGDVVVEPVSKEVSASRTTGGDRLSQSRVNSYSYGDWEDLKRRCPQDECLLPMRRSQGGQDPAQPPVGSRN